MSRSAHARMRPQPRTPYGHFDAYDWLARDMVRLGREPDSAIARDLGISRHAVRRERMRRGISRWRVNTVWHEHECGDNSPPRCARCGLVYQSLQGILSTVPGGKFWTQYEGSNKPPFYFRMTRPQKYAHVYPCLPAADADPAR